MGQRYGFSGFIQIQFASNKGLNSMFFNI